MHFGKQKPFNSMGPVQGGGEGERGRTVALWGVGDREQALSSYEFRKDLADANKGHKIRAERVTDTQPDW